MYPNAADAHGMLVHFPIALLFTSVALEIAALVPRLRSLAPAALATLVLGAIGAVAAVVSGPEPGGTNLMGSHHNFAHLTLILFGALAVARLWLVWKRRPLTRTLLSGYLLLAVVGLAMLGYTGYLGGRMVYEQAIGVQRNGVPVVPPQPRHFPGGGGG